jgi:prophage regulatory protein
MAKTVNLTYSVLADAASRIQDAEFWDADDLETLTGTVASTWRFWAYKRWGPASFKLGKRRVWRRSVVMAWLAEQEQADAGDA